MALTAQGSHAGNSPRTTYLVFLWAMLLSVMAAIGRELRYFLIYRTYSSTVPDQTSERGELTQIGYCSPSLATT